MLVLTTCSAENPDLDGNRVTEGSVCEELLLAQCACCEDGTANCLAAIKFGIERDVLYVNLTPSECVEQLDGRSGPTALCDRLNTPRLMERGCFGFPPGSLD